MPRWLSVLHDPSQCISRADAESEVESETAEREVESTEVPEATPDTKSEATPNGETEPTANAAATAAAAAVRIISRRRGICEPRVMVYVTS